MTVDEAELKAKQITENCREQIDALRKEYDDLVKNFKRFRNRFKSLIKEEMETIDDIFSDVDEHLTIEGLYEDNHTSLGEDEVATSME